MHLRGYDSVTLLEIDLADGKLLIGPPTRFPAMLRVVSDPQRAHSALFTVWQQREHSGTIRRSWSDLFPGAPLPGHSDSQLQQQLQGALRSGRLNAVFVRKPRRALNAVKPDQQRDRVMHVALTNKTVLLAPKGQLPRDLAKESSKTTRADAVLRGIPPKHPLVNTIGQQASRVLPPALANGSRKELVQQLTRQLSSGQLEGAVLDQAELVRRAASLPSAPKPVSRMSAKEKVYEALARSYDLCGGDLGAALKKLRDPHNLAMMVGFMLVLAGVQLIPGVDVVVDFGMLIWLLYTVGTKAVIGVKELVKAVSAALDAKDDRQLDTAARHFADAFEALGEAGISALLAFLQGLRLAGRFAKAGEAEGRALQRATGQGTSRPEPQAPVESLSNTAEEAAKQGAVSVTAQSADEIAKLSTHIAPGSDRVVLGKWPGYIDEAKANGGTWFETPSGYFDRLKAQYGDQAAEEAWKTNEAFLRQQLSTGRPIEMTEGGIAHAIDRPNSMTARELDYLMKNSEQYGYKRVGTTQWIKGQ